MRQGSAHTLPALIAELREAIDINAPALSVDFEEKILQAKYRNEHEEHYANRGYSERAFEFYLVKDDFPRIQESGLASGVTEVTYKISLECCRSFMQPIEKVLEIVREYCD